MSSNFILGLIFLTALSFVINLINVRLYRARYGSSGDFRCIIVFSIINCIALFLIFIFLCIAFAYMPSKGVTL